MKHKQGVDIPLVFFSLAFFIVLFGLFSKMSFQKNTYKEPIQPIKPSLQEDNNKKLPSLNYSAPILCAYKDKQSSISAAMDTSSVVLHSSINSISKSHIVNGDCVYSWIKNEKIGVKKCGVGQYLGIGRQLLGSGLMTIDSLKNMSKQLGKDLPVDPIAFLTTCKNVKEMKKEIFMLPKGVVFK